MITEKGIAQIARLLMSAFTCTALHAAQVWRQPPLRDFLLFDLSLNKVITMN
jgi:hypothetical protein